MSVLINKFAAPPHRCTGWAGAGFLDGIKHKFTGRDHIVGLFRWRGRGWARAVGRLVAGEFRVARAKLIIGDIAIDAVVVQVLHVRFVGIAGVGGDLRAREIQVIVNAQALVA